MLKIIPPEETKMGMFVHSFEGKWLTHPFWKAKFTVSSTEELARIRAGKVRVVIDTEKGCDAISPPDSPHPITRKIQAYAGSNRSRAVQLAHDSSVLVKAMFEDARLGAIVNPDGILVVVDNITDELSRNTSAFDAFKQLKAKDDATYTHSSAVCALMITLAKELGDSSAVIRQLGLAGLFHDIGKVFIPDKILQKPGTLDPLEIAEVRRHPAYGHEILRQSSGVPPVVLDVCLHHHERPDGKGYPFGLSAEAIGRAARIASICDVYDALTSVRAYKKGMSSLAAISLMDASDGQFDREILFVFMRAIGVYPIGKLVMLEHGRLAVTLAPRPTGIGPVFRVFYSTAKSEFLRTEDIVMGGGHSRNVLMPPESWQQWFEEQRPRLPHIIINDM